MVGLPLQIAGSIVILSIVYFFLQDNKKDLSVYNHSLISINDIPHEIVYTVYGDWTRAERRRAKGKEVKGESSKVKGRKEIK